MVCVGWVPRAERAAYGYEENGDEEVWVRRNAMQQEGGEGRLLREGWPPALIGGGGSSR